MQDASSFVSFYDRASESLLNSDYDIQSKVIISDGKSPRDFSRLLTFQSNPEKTMNRQEKKRSKYEPPMSDRESWWRVAIKDTPNPGTYDTHLNTFIKETVARPMTYGFKNDGRRRDPQPSEPKGKELLPGAYPVGSFVEEILQRRFSYGFNGSTREDSFKKTVLANHDKDIDLAPGLYETQKYHRINVPAELVRHSFFKSKTRRKLFPPKDGPAPGDYNPKTKIIDTKSPTITSSFRSRTDRFRKKSFNVPGPGAYETLTGVPPWKQLDSYLTQGICFNADFSHAT